MTTDEREMIQQRVGQLLMEQELKTEAKQHSTEKVQSVPQDEDLMDGELAAIKTMFMALEPLSVMAQQRCLRFVDEFLREQSQRDQYMTQQLLEQAGGCAAPAPMAMAEVSRRRG